MPELPEVEVTRLGLHPHLIGKEITGITVRQPKLRWQIDPQIKIFLKDSVITNTRRRGKYLLLEIAQANHAELATKGWLIFHLGMSGTLRIIHSDEPASIHDHIDVHFGLISVRFRDPRRFGAMVWHPIEQGDVEQHPLLRHLGIEPLSCEFADKKGALHLYQHSRGRTQSIKQLLLAGRAVVGVGNIYASEALFHAGIHPMTPSGKVGLVRYTRLANAIRSTLQAAITRGGSSLRDFVASDGASGYFQLDCMVYGRAKQPCRICKTPIQQLSIGQRSSFFCPRCQRA